MGHVNGADNIKKRWRPGLKALNTAIGQTGRLLTYSFRQERYGCPR